MTHRMVVRLRLLLRWARRWVTGARWTVPLPDRERVRQSQVERFLANVLPFVTARRGNNRPLLTGMAVALLTGMVTRGPMSGWQAYRGAARRRTHLHRGIPCRLVGRALVTKFPREPRYRLDGVKIPGPVASFLSEVEWAPGYVTRREQLAARRRLRGAV
jgi:hypothetical protein